MLEYWKVLISLLLRSERVLNQPIAMNVDTGNVCNLSCKMCFRNEPYFSHQPQQFLDTTTLEKIYLQIKPRITLFGGLSGEPLTNKNICELVKIATANRSKSFMTTNGILLDKNTAFDLVKNGIYLIKFSLDAAIGETYIKIRKNNNFDKVLNNIRELYRIKKELKIKREMIRLDFIIQKDNIDEIVPFILLAKDLNVSFVSFAPVNFLQFTEETAREFRENYDLGKIIKILRKGREIAAQIGVKNNIGDLLKCSDKITNIKKYALKESDFYFPWYKYTRGSIYRCMYPWLQIAINITGEVSICCSTFSRNIEIERGLILGNIRNENLSDIWNGDKLRKIRKMFLKKENFSNFDICRRCIQKLNIYYEIRMNNLLVFR